jgi:putative intracellular protease/amidase
MNTVLILLSQRFADWEAAYICPELNKLDNYEIKTVSLSKNPVVTMGGLHVIPDYTLDDIPNEKNIKLLLIPGGLSWDKPEYKKYCELIRQCLENNILTAAICNAVTFLAENGFLDNRKHTGNTLEYLKENAKGYKGEKEYIVSQSVLSENLITANGSAAVEFSRDILKALEIMSDDELNNWFHMFKKGFL